MLVAVWSSDDEASLEPFAENMTEANPLEWPSRWQGEQEFYHPTAVLHQR